MNRLTYTCIVLQLFFVTIPAILAGIFFYVKHYKHNDGTKYLTLNSAKFNI
jgi:hypothetical protein